MRLNVCHCVFFTLVGLCTRFVDFRLFAFFSFFFKKTFPVFSGFIAHILLLSVNILITFAETLLKCFWF